MNVGFRWASTSASALAFTSALRPSGTDGGAALRGGQTHFFWGFFLAIDPLPSKPPITSQSPPPSHHRPCKLALPRQDREKVVIGRSLRGGGGMVGWLLPRPPVWSGLGPVPRSP